MLRQRERASILPDLFFPGQRAERGGATRQSNDLAVADPGETGLETRHRDKARGQPQVQRAARRSRALQDAGVLVVDASGCLREIAVRELDGMRRCARLELDRDQQYVT